MLVPVILAGGSGTRLWPLSRGLYPKQFLPLTSDQTMLQDTLLRLQGLEHSKPQVVCNEEHRFLVAEQLRSIGEKADIILEPVGRNTAPAIALSALVMEQNGEGDAVMLILAADHLIQSIPKFQDAVLKARDLAVDGQLVTFGIVPTEPHVGYGYIRGGESIDQCCMVVDSFVEKPDSQTAQRYCDSGDYFWNSGMFMFRADSYLKELKKNRPDIYQVCKEVVESQSRDHDFIRFNETLFETCPEDSIDYAVMECTDKAVVIPMDAGWSDVGSWSSLWDVKTKNADENVLIGDVLCDGVNNSLIYSNERLVAALGIDDLVIVDTKDALLVANKDSVQNIKNIVSLLKKEERNEHLFHREVQRPWGKYDTVDSGERYQVKRITVQPGAKLSLQKHHHRAEHWVVVRGTAKVRCDDMVQLLTENQSTYIPVGALHQLENPGKLPLEIIEIQSGSYLGEDDIERYEDQYGRV